MEQRCCAARNVWNCRTAAYALREVAGALSSGGHAGSSRLSANFLIPLLAPEEEQLVLQNRTTKGIAIIIPSKLVLPAIGKGLAISLGRRLSPGRKVFTRIQQIVAPKVERATMKRIRSAARCDVNHRSGGLPIFGAIGVAQHLEFGDRVHGRIDQDRAV